MFPIATYIKGEALTITTGAGDAETSIKTEVNVGKLVGISINKAYTDQIMSQILLTIRQGKANIFEAVPADYFIPTTDRPYFPVSRLLRAAGDEINNGEGDAEY